MCKICKRSWDMHSITTYYRRVPLVGFSHLCGFHHVRRWKWLLYSHKNNDQGQWYVKMCTSQGLLTVVLLGLFESNNWCTINKLYLAIVLIQLEASLNCHQNILPKVLLRSSVSLPVHVGSPITVIWRFLPPPCLHLQHLYSFITMDSSYVPRRLKQLASNEGRSFLDL